MCPCDILSGRVFEQLVNSSAVTISVSLSLSPPQPQPLVVLDRMLLTYVNLCIYAMLRTRATFSWPTLYFYDINYAFFGSS